MSGQHTVTNAMMKKYVPQILAVMPDAWRGTTYKNDNLLGRRGFETNLSNLIQQKEKDGSKITEADLNAVGNAEDYLRVSSNISTTLEIALAVERNIVVEQVFTWSSSTMPALAVALTSGNTPVHVYVATDDKNTPFDFSVEQQSVLKSIGADFTLHRGTPVAHGDDIVLADTHVAADAAAGVVDGELATAQQTLFVCNTKKIDPAQLLIIRKRMCTPVTTPEAERMLQAWSGLPVTADQAEATDDEVKEFLAHLQTLSGTDVNPSAQPVVTTAGLPAICSFWVTLIGRGGADVLMCSTAYGGSNQLTDLLNERADKLHKHTFDIQGERDIFTSINDELEALAAKKDKLMPTTVLMVEIPTNPDMKVPNMKQVSEALKNYAAKSGTEVILMVDGTFAPNSQVMRQMREYNEDMSVVVFLSMSKSVSRGMTTAGTIITNHTPQAQKLAQQVAVTAKLLDSTAKKNQMHYLVKNRVGVEERCANAYKVAVSAGNALVTAVKEFADVDMTLAFVSPEQAKTGFTTSTFSFNLPPVGDADECAALAQTYTDHLCAHKEFKPCVSFGQDNGIVYATVPATSTQGAIKDEHKDKQAVGGVQLTRLSFPPTCDGAAVEQIMVDAVRAVYCKDGKKRKR